VELGFRRFTVLALIRLILRFVWLTLFILGVRRALEIAQGGANDLIERIEEGEAGTAERLLARLHEALHHRHGNSPDGGDAFGEL
jgi:hypothetical protein